MTTETTTSMTIVVNDEQRTVPADTTCRSLVAQITGRDVGADGRPTRGLGLGVAVAVGGSLVPRARWDATVLHDGDSVEIVTAVQGG